MAVVITLNQLMAQAAARAFGFKDFSALPPQAEGARGQSPIQKSVADLYGEIRALGALLVRNRPELRQACEDTSNVVHLPLGPFPREPLTQLPVTQEDHEEVVEEPESSGYPQRRLGVMTCLGHDPKKQPTLLLAFMISTFDLPLEGEGPHIVSRSTLARLITSESDTLSLRAEKYSNAGCDGHGKPIGAIQSGEACLVTISPGRFRHSHLIHYAGGKTVKVSLKHPNEALFGRYGTSVLSLLSGAFAMNVDPYFEDGTPTAISPAKRSIGGG